MWEGWVEENEYRDLTWLVGGMNMAQLNGVLMAPITGSRLLTSVEQDGCATALKPKKQGKETSGENETAQVLTGQNSLECVQFII